MQPKLVSFREHKCDILSVEEDLGMEKLAFVDGISKRSGIIICVRF